MQIEYCGILGTGECGIVQSVKMHDLINDIEMTCAFKKMNPEDALFSKLALLHEIQIYK
jgi:hypothetical protein